MSGPEGMEVKMLINRQPASCCSTAQPACKSSARQHVNRVSTDSLPGGCCSTKLNRCRPGKWLRTEPASRKSAGRNASEVAGPKRGCSLTNPVTLTKKPPGAPSEMPGSERRMCWRTVHDPFTRRIRSGERDFVNVQAHRHCDKGDYAPISPQCCRGSP